METSDDSTQLWDYALALYAARDVAEACLTLQDAGGADVCELLWACWLARRGLVPSDDAERELGDVRAWQGEFTRALRAQRRALKPAATQHAGLARLRQTIKDAELLAEREALARLQALAEQGRGVRPARPDDTLSATLRRLIPRRDATIDAALARLARTADAEPGPPC